MDYEIEFEVEDDGRWIADIPALPGVMAYGATKHEAQI
jgi:predicted RNase H-like HicB family nuclease